MALRPILDDILPIPDPLLKLRCASIYATEDITYGVPPVSVSAGVTAALTTSRVAATTASLLLPMAAASPWALATGSTGHAFVIETRPGMLLASGSTLGAHYSLDGGATWNSSFIITAATGRCGYSPDLDVVTWRGGTEVQTSTDGGLTFTLHANAGVSSTPITWSSRLSLFIIITNNVGFCVETSPDGITWTPRTTPFDYGVGSRAIIDTGTHIVTSSTATMTSLNGIDWTLVVGGPASISVGWSPLLNQLVSMPLSGWTGDVRVSDNTGETWTTVFDVFPDAASYTLPRSLRWVPEIGAYLVAVNTIPSGTNASHMYSWSGSPLDQFIGGEAYRAAAIGATEVYSIYYSGEFKRYSMYTNSGVTEYSNAGPLVNALLGAPQDGPLRGNSLFVSNITPPAGALSNYSQVYSTTAGNALAFRTGSTSYPVAGPHVKTAGRFDASLSQTLYADDGVISIVWNGVAREAKYIPTVSGFAGGTEVSSNTYYSFSTANPTTAVGTSVIITAGVSYFVSSAQVAATGAVAMNRFVPQVVHQQLYANNAPTLATVPYYELKFMVGVLALGNYMIEKVYLL